MQRFAILILKINFRTKSASSFDLMISMCKQFVRYKWIFKISLLLSKYFLKKILDFLSKTIFVTSHTTANLCKFVQSCCVLRILLQTNKPRAITSGKQRAKNQPPLSYSLLFLIHPLFLDMCRRRCCYLYGLGLHHFLSMPLLLITFVSCCCRCFCCLCSVLLCLSYCK